jgi:hypothetical protein
MIQCHGTYDAKEGIMRLLATQLTAVSLSVFALLASTTTNTPLDCYQFGSFDEAQAAYEADLAKPFPTLEYLDDDGDGLICECLYYEEICWVPSSELPTPAAGLPTDANAAGAVPPRERLEGLREERRQ